MVALDSSAGPARALPVAAEIADRLEVSIDILAVAPSRRSGQLLDLDVRRAAEEVASWVGEARVAYDFAVAHRIVAAAASTSVVACLASEWPKVGSIARRVLAHSDGPVIRVGPAATQQLGSKMVTCLAGAQDERLLGVASSWADALGLTHVVVSTTRPRHDRNRAGGSPPSIELPSGHPVRAVASFVHDEGCGLLALGWPRGAFARWHPAARLTAALVRTSPSPLLVVPLR